MLARLVILFTLMTITAQARVEYDRKDKIKGVSLQSGKENGLRTYRGYTTRVYPYPMAMVKDSILNYSEKCNNALRKKRELTDVQTDCKYHNENIIESVVIRDLKPGWTREHGEIDRFVLGKRTYNRGVSGYYELVQLIKGKDKKGKETLVIHQKMLSNAEAKTFTAPKIKKESAFDRSLVKYILTEVGPGQTELKYVYTATTDHWILNKELSIPQVFATLSSSINTIVGNVELEATRINREIASQEE